MPTFTGIKGRCSLVSWSLLEHAHVGNDFPQFLPVLRCHGTDRGDGRTGIDPDHGERLLDDDGEGAETEGDPERRQPELGVKCPFVVAG